MSGSERTCDECGIQYEYRSTRARWCPSCALAVTRRLTDQAGELARLRRDRRDTCKRCGEPIEIDRSEGTTNCYRCSPPSWTKDVLGEFAKPGVWRIGPVVFDWSGVTSAARCDECSRLHLWRWGERIHKTAINHAKYWHGTTGKPHRVLAPMRTVECEWPDCLGMVVTSEDEPARFCAAHREVAA